MFFSVSYSGLDIEIKNIIENGSPSEENDRWLK